MRRPTDHGQPTALLIVCLLVTFVSTATLRTDASEHDAQAIAILQRMADLLSQTKRLSVTAETGFDVVQDSGAKLEFGEIRQIVIRRPDRARVDITRRDGGKGGFIFDGQQIAVFNSRENVYATATRPGTFDDALDYFINDLDMRFPMAELFSSKLAETLREKVREAYYVERAVIAGVTCDHLAFRGDQADLQLWIAQGDQPLPHRLIITYRDAVGQPQFWAQFADWNLAPDTPDSRFGFTPPEGAAKIAFAAHEPAPPPQGEQR